MRWWRSGYSFEQACVHCCSVQSRGDGTWPKSWSGSAVRARGSREGGRGQRPEMRGAWHLPVSSGWGWEVSGALEEAGRGWAAAQGLVVTSSGEGAKRVSLSTPTSKLRGSGCWAGRVLGRQRSGRVPGEVLGPHGGPRARSPCSCSFRKRDVMCRGQGLQFSEMADPGPRMQCWQTPSRQHRQSRIAGSQTHQTLRTAHGTLCPLHARSPGIGGQGERRRKTETDSL